MVKEGKDVGEGDKLGIWDLTENTLLYNKTDKQ